MTLFGLETEYDSFIALLSSIDASFQRGTGTLKVADDCIYGQEKTIKTKDITFTNENALNGSILCLRFNAETGKFLGGWCDDGF